MTKQTAALFSVFSNSILIILKIIAGVAMGSVSVISEAIHSGIDLLASCIAYFSIRKSLAPADSDHPYGHGKFENISGFAEAMLIFVAAGMIIYEAVKKIIHPMEVGQLDWGIGVMLVSVILNTFISRLLFKISKKENSIALEADAMHLSMDVLTSLGVLVGLVIIRFTHLTILDPIIAFAVAAMILKASWSLTRKSLEDLADKALPEKEVALIRDIITSHPLVLDYHRLRSRKSGNQREIDIHMKVDKNMTIDKAHELCTKVEKDIRDKLPGTYVITHLEPFIHPHHSG
jgi:cation diffusion facilitator family transporter